MEDFLTVLFMIHEKVTDFIAGIIFAIPVGIEAMIWAFKLFKDPIYGDKIAERMSKDKKYRNKVANYFLRKCSLMNRLKKKFQVYCCPLHVEW